MNLSNVECHNQCITQNEWFKTLKPYSSITIITDHVVKPLYAELLAKRLNAHLICIPSGESHKNRQSKALIEDQLLQQSFDRQGLLIALGGGMITDLVGFVAATYQRGVRHVHIPTTLLAMVDAAIGGKNGINTSYAKNSIGSFKSAEKIIIDPSFLSTCKTALLNDGLVESLKHGLIADAGYWELLSSHIEAIQHHQCPLLQPLILTSINIKQQIVAQDRKDHGTRQILNCGHTIGHALEQHSQYQLSHGSAVALGIVLESHIACALKLQSEATLQRIKNGFKSFINVKTTQWLGDTDALINIMRYDKKNENGNIKMALIKKIGQENITSSPSHAIPIDLIKAVITKYANPEFLLC
jgi:3-dehydroquinate synthase